MNGWMNGWTILITLAELWKVFRIKQYKKWLVSEQWLFWHQEDSQDAFNLDRDAVCVHIMLIEQQFGGSVMLLHKQDQYPRLKNKLINNKFVLCSTLSVWNINESWFL